MDLDTIVDGFLMSRRADGVTENTLTWHTMSLNTFLAWIKENNQPTDPQEWSAVMLRSYIVWLQKETDYTPSTITTKVQSLLAFTRWLEQEEFTATNVGARVKKPKLPQVQKPPFTEDELRKIMEWSARSSRRDYAIICLLIDCGLRVSEVCNLKIRNIHFSQGLLTVHGKGQKDRVAPFSSQTGNAIQRYLMKERDPDSELEEVFLSVRGGRMTSNGILQMVYRVAEKARVDNVHPHRFRHTFAITYLRNGGDPLTLQRILGHTTLDMSNRYVAYNNDDLHKAHLDASPLVNLRKSRKGR